MKPNNNTRQNNNTVTVDSAKYRALLEDHAEQSIEIRSLRDTLQKEFDFAEEKLQEVAKLNAALERVTNFLEMRGLVDEWTEYNKMLDSEPVGETETA